MSSHPSESRPVLADLAAEWGWRREPGEEGIDHFDRLPDSILLVIFNRIGDVKALGRCCVVSRRFHALVPLVDYVVVRVDCVISDDPSSSSSPSPSSSSSSPTAAYKARGVFSHLARLVFGGIVRPLQALGQILGPNAAAAALSTVSSAKLTRDSPSSCSSSSSSSEVSHHSPTEVLKNFREIRRLRIQLPAGELGVEEGVLLKWNAGFGSTLDSCVILGASSILPSSQSPAPAPAPSSHDLCSATSGSGDDTSGTMPESFYTNGSLKMRVVWTISSLIAASARHYLLQPIIADHHHTLQSLDLTDADGQGVLTMNRQQLQELQMRPFSASDSSQRTLVPALSMRLWYAPHLELPGGMVLKGATLVAIRPSEEQLKEATGGTVEGCWISDAFEEPYRTAVTTLLKRRNYCLEMNSF